MIDESTGSSVMSFVRRSSQLPFVHSPGDPSRRVSGLIGDPFFQCQFSCCLFAAFAYGTLRNLDLLCTLLLTIPINDLTCRAS